MTPRSTALTTDCTYRKLTPGPTNQRRIPRIWSIMAIATNVVLVGPGAMTAVRRQREFSLVDPV